MHIGDQVRYSGRYIEWAPTTSGIITHISSKNFIQDNVSYGVTWEDGTFSWHYKNSIALLTCPNDILKELM